jgi:ferritin-like metal-binding protein YciE
MGMLIQDEPRMMYVTGLRNAHAMETQAIELLTRQINRLENYPALEAQMRHHLKESETQRARLQDVLEGLSESPSTVKETVLGLGGNLAAMAHMPASDEIIKNTIANYAFEHFEIAAYKSLLVMAEWAGDSAGATAAQSSLKEEEIMAAWIDANIGETTRIFLQRLKAGASADH